MGKKHHYSCLTLKQLDYSDVVSRTRGPRPRPRPQKNSRPWPKTALPKADPIEAKDRNARDQGPRTPGASVLRKKRSSKEIF